MVDIIPQMYLFEECYFENLMYLLFLLKMLLKGIIPVIPILTGIKTQFIIMPKNIFIFQ